MAGYPEHWLFSFGGTILNGQEIWQNNIRFATTSGIAAPQIDEESLLEDLMADLAVAFVLAPWQGGLGYSNGTTLTHGKFNKIAPDGGYSDEGNTVRQDLAAPLQTTATPPTFAPQLALAVSWLTDRTRGLANKGRIYIPMPALTPDGSGQVGPALRQNIADNWAGLLNQFNNEPGIDTSTLTASVVSGVRDGAKEQIRSVRVGSVLDTMRSRRNALVETYTTAPVPGQ
jgi:hypothetical protein